jgi:hypothetical protein
MSLNNRRIIVASEVNKNNAQNNFHEILNVKFYLIIESLVVGYNMNMQNIVVFGTFFAINVLQCFNSYGQTYFFLDAVNRDETDGISFKDISYAEMEKEIYNMQNPDDLTSKNELKSDKYTEITTASAAFGIKPAKDVGLLSL